MDTATGATWASLVTWPSWVIHRPARSISAAGSSTRPSGSRPIRPTPRTVTSTWCATSQSSPGRAERTRESAAEAHVRRRDPADQGQRGQHRKAAAGRREGGQAARHEHGTAGQGQADRSHRPSWQRTGQMARRHAGARTRWQTDRTNWHAGQPD